MQVVTPVCLLTDHKLQLFMKANSAGEIDQRRSISRRIAACRRFPFRLRQTLTEDRHTMQPFDQENWANTYAAYSAQEALAFAALRQWNLALVRSLGARDFDQAATYSERAI
jgi:hypothetical protein